MPILHLHSHFFPADLQKGALARTIVSSGMFPAPPNGEVGAYRSPLHPFDTLILTGTDRLTLTRKVAQIMHSLESDHLVATVGYYDGHFMIVAQRPSLQGYARNEFGARTLVNYFKAEELTD